MAICYITIGNIGELKSTWARERAYREFDTLIVSRDAIREMVFGQYGYKNAIEPIIKEMALTSAVVALKHENNVIIDETNVTRRKRIELINDINILLTENDCPKARFVYVHFGSSLDGLAKRQADPRNMTADKWAEVWKDLNSIYELPSYDEGVDEIVDMRPKKTLVDVMRKYAVENNLPFVMPDTFMCPSCRQSFHHLVDMKNPKHITSCPICNYSFLGG
jgi:hydrogenase maturation factor